MTKRLIELKEGDYEILYDGGEYTTIELIEDLREELRRHSELLAQMFPERVNRYTDRDLSRLWRGSNYQYIHRIKSKIQS